MIPVGSQARHPCTTRAVTWTVLVWNMGLGSPARDPRKK